MALSDYQSLVDDLVRDDSGLIDVPARDTAIGLAVQQYSEDRPRMAAEDVVSPGGHLLDLPVAWVASFSALIQIEYPVGDVPPRVLADGSFDFYLDAVDGSKILLLNVSPASGESVRLTFTVPHTLDGSSDTIPQRDREAVACWAAALLLDQLASRHSGDSDSTIQADRVDRSAAARSFAGQAKAFRKRYYDGLGVDPGRLQAAGAVVDWDLSNSRGGDRLTHTNRRR